MEREVREGQWRERGKGGIVEREVREGQWSGMNICTV